MRTWKAVGEDVKNFFGDQVAVSSIGGPPEPPVHGAGPTPAPSSPHSALLAVYDAPAAAPRTEEVASHTETGLVEEIASRTFIHARDAGGEIPYTVIREVTENFIHANFREPVVSIMDGGRTIRFADQGPGIRDKDRAVLPGFTTATRGMRHVIRGVGSGLPIVKDYLGFSGGSLEIDDNLGDGTVVTVRSPQPPPDPGATEAPVLEASPGDALHAASGGFAPLTTRQKQVLSLVLELGEVGPTIVSKELSVALSTAYRDLAFLENSGLIESDASGKRILTPEGSSYLDSLFAL